MKEVEVGTFKFIPIMTPGHSSDSVTFYFKDDNAMFVGDFIFRDTVVDVIFLLVVVKRWINLLKELKLMMIPFLYIQGMEMRLL